MECKVAAARSPVARHTVVPLLEFAEVSITEGPGAALARVLWRFTPARAIPGSSPAPAPASPSCPIAVPPLISSSGVSIVIPVLDQPEYTLLCLREVVATCAAGSYEIIVVDNASAAPTATALAGVAGLRVIRNERNVGFGEACNQGARSARGKWLLFLNNDTVPRSGWLRALTEAAAAPGVGAVGAKLLYPDGRLQEAGSVVWRDGSGWNYGHNEPADAPEYCYVREVDYCSAACLLVNRGVFLELGGFDPRYAPAYYEDTDLCFRLRERGLHTLYQPEAQVVHFRGVTAGTDPAVGPKRSQDINRRTFVERHADALGAHMSLDASRLRQARHRTTGRHLLIVDHMVPEPDRDSGSVRMTAILTAFRALGHHVTFLPDNAAASQPYTAALQQRGVEVLFGPFATPAWVAAHAREFDVVILSRARFALKYLAAVHHHRDRPALVFDTVDLHHLRELRMAAHQQDPEAGRRARDTRGIELAAMYASDRVWVTSTFEAEALRSYPALPPVDVVSNVHETRLSVPGFAPRRDLLFVGGFRHSPNEDAVRFFVRDILPLVLRTLPQIRLLVVGPASHPRCSGWNPPTSRSWGRFLTSSPCSISADCPWRRCASAPGSRARSARAWRTACR